LTRYLSFLLGVTLVAVLGTAALLALSGLPGGENDSQALATPFTPSQVSVADTPTPTETPDSTPNVIPDFDTIDTEAAERERIRASILSVLGVRVGSGCGTAFAVARAQGGTILVTCEHVTKAEPYVPVILPDGTEYEAKLLSEDPGADIALLLLEDVDHLPLLQLGNPDEVQIADPLYVVGFALGTRLLGDPSVTKGVLSGRRMVRDVDFLQTDAVMNPGNSGGPVLNHKGEVVGVASWGLVGTEGLVIQGLSFATPAVIIEKHLDLLPFELSY
jgi:serine protease Do